MGMAASFVLRRGRGCLFSRPGEARARTFSFYDMIREIHFAHRG